MKIVVSSQGASLDAASSTVFGRCPTFVFVDSDTMEFEAMPNPAMSQGGGAGIQAAQFVINQGAQAVLSGHLGPNAFDVLDAAGVPGYLVPGGTVRQAVEGYTAGELQLMAGASGSAEASAERSAEASPRSVAAHAGMGGGRPAGAGRDMSAETAQPDAAAAHQAELAELRESLKGLRQQLAETMETIQKLEKEA
jgi:predicted Fe-Mo cluster-binding NifX family protein